MVGKARPSGRSLKSHATYTIGELALAVGAHPRTVGNWRRKGLEPIDDRRPLLFKGADVKAFLSHQRKSRRRPCKAGEIYCFSCQAPRRCEGGLADLIRPADGNGIPRLVGFCDVCGTLMNRFVRAADVKRVCAGLDVVERVEPNAYPGAGAPPEIASSSMRSDR